MNILLEPSLAGMPYVFSTGISLSILFDDSIQIWLLVNCHAICFELGNQFEYLVFGRLR